jgi:hypothetical protein
VAVKVIHGAGFMFGSPDWLSDVKASFHSPA